MKKVSNHNTVALNRHMASVSYRSTSTEIQCTHLTTAIPFLSCIKRVTDNNMTSSLLETIVSYPDPFLET